MKGSPKNKLPPVPWLLEFEAAHGPVKRRVVKPKAAKPPELSGEDVFAHAWAATRFSAPEREFRFHPVRKWRFDFAWPHALVALEVDGYGCGGSPGRHHTFVGAREDYEKLNEALLLGWRVLHVMAADKKEVATWVEMVRRAILTLPVCVPTDNY